MVNKPQHLYEFGPFRIDPAHRQLLREGQTVAIQPKAFDVLLVLVENSEKVVSKDDLIKTVWPDTFVEESNLSQHIFVLRKALGDTVDEKRYIVTVPGRGYRFAGPVNVVAVAEVVVKEGIPEASDTQFVDEEDSLIVASHTRSRTLVEEQIEPVKALPAVTRGWGTIAVGFACVALLGGVAYLLMPRSNHHLNKQDTVVLADFTNRTGDPVFDDTLKTALGISLDQSPFLNTLSNNKVRKTLALMARPADTKVSPEVAREVCQRAGGKAYIAGSIVQLGSEYVLTLEASSCQTGDSMAREQATAAAKEKVLDALGSAATKLRPELGESLATVQKFDVTLRQATTPSLDALKAYSVGAKLFYQVNPAAALPYFEQALELDPNFAMAYVELGNTYMALNQRGRARECFAKAFPLRDRTSEIERLNIAAEYYGYTTGELDKALQAMQEDIEYKHGSVYLGLADIYARLGQYDKSAEAARTLLARDPDYGFAFVQLAADDIALQDSAGARQVIQQAQARGIDNYFLHNDLYMLSFLQSDSAGMAAQQTWFTDNRVPVFQHYGPALAADTEAYVGHVTKARELTTQAVNSALQSDDKDDAANYRANRALQQAAYGNFTDARQFADEALKLAPENPNVAVQAGLALAIAGDTARALAVVQDLGKRFPKDMQLQALGVPPIEAQLQLARNQTDLALNTLRPGLQIELGNTSFSATNTSCLYATYVRGQAYLAAGQGRIAAAEFQKIIDHNGIVGNCWTGALAHLGVARANVLEAGASQGPDADAARSRAVAAYRDFFALWRGADPGVPILKAAKAESIRLQ
ncbi:MAG TPA: winged helix-turn-helix domain-containing protein [Terriglobales bacterium]